MRRHLRCSIGGSASTNEIPPLGTLLHLSNEETNGFPQVALLLATVKAWKEPRGSTLRHERGGGGSITAPLHLEGLALLGPPRGD